MRVDVNSFATMRVKFSLSNSAIDKEAICDEVKDFKGLEQGKHPFTVEIVEPHERWFTGEL